MRIIDLSFPIRSGMPVFPGDPEVQIGHALTVESDTVAVSALALGSHSGTHIDAPAHTVEGGATIDAFALADLIGEAAHLRVRRPADLARVDAAAVESPLPDRLPSLVVVTAGWDEHFGSERMVRHPFLDPEFASELLARGMRVLVIDWLNPDPTLQDGEFALPVHDLVLGAGGAIVENLRGAHDLPDRFELTIAPLPIAGADGAPVRAFARLTDSA